MEIYNKELPPYSTALSLNYNLLRVLSEEFNDTYIDKLMVECAIDCIGKNSFFIPSENDIISTFVNPDSERIQYSASAERKVFTSNVEISLPLATLSSEAPIVYVRTSVNDIWYPFIVESSVGKASDYPVALVERITIDSTDISDMEKNRIAIKVSLPSEATNGKGYHIYFTTEDPNSPDSRIFDSETNLLVDWLSFGGSAALSIAGVVGAIAIGGPVGILVGVAAAGVASSGTILGIRLSK